MSRFPHDAKVYVGDLGSNASKQEIEDAFGYYGPLRSVWVARNPPVSYEAVDTFAHFTYAGFVLSGICIRRI